MATATISAVSPCSGGGHWAVTASINGGPNRVFSISKADLLTSADDQSLFDKFVARIRSELLESGASTMAQVRNALIGPTFQV